MSDITCDQLRAATLDPGASPRDWTRLPEATAHVRHCAACQDWLDAFNAGARVWTSVPADDFTDRVIARTAGLDAILRGLPVLADMDPGPGFTERVLRATSMTRDPVGWRARASAGWRALVRRPRFAWEAAYVATVCWVLLFGNPVGAIEWSATNIGAVARERLGPSATELRAGLETWRATLNPESPSARGTPAGAMAGPAPPVLRAWQASADWVRGVAASVAEAFSTAWEMVIEWFARVLGEPSNPSTEPPAGAARSHH
jgi:hypothetical protein